MAIVIFYLCYVFVCVETFYLDCVNFYLHCVFFHLRCNFLSVVMFSICIDDIYLYCDFFPFIASFLLWLFISIDDFYLRCMFCSCGFFISISSLYLS